MEEEEEFENYELDEEWVEDEGEEEEEEEEEDQELLEEQQRAQERMMEEGHHPPVKNQHRELVGSERRGRKFLSKFERARLLGARAIQIANNAPVMVDIGTGPNKIINPVTIAEMELNARVLPLKIRRFNPDLTYEDWAIEELKFHRYY